MKKYTISEINIKVKQMVEINSTFKNMNITGEISNIKYYERHCYFSLKDQNSSISAVAFNYNYMNNFPLDLKTGDMVDILANINIYEKDAKLQLLVKHLEKQNELGDKLVKLLKMEEEYRKKGYFDNKQPIPKHINKLGVVTARTGSAIQDIIKTTKNRNKNVDIYLYSARVQGVGASKEIAKGIEELNKIDEIQAIIVGRGGGSIEELWCFNESEVVEAIHNSKKPIISAVGHEDNILLSDKVADLRASTPTQAVELIIFDRKKEDENLSKYLGNMKRILSNQFETYQKNLDRIKNSYYIKNINQVLLDKNQILDMKKMSLEKHINKIYVDNKNYLLSIKKELDKRIEQKIYQTKTNIYVNKLKLEKYSITDTLNRGYTITTDKDGNIISNIDNIKQNDEIYTHFSNGKILSVVNDKEK